MDGINKDLNDKVNRECMIKNAVVAAKKKQKKMRPITRSRIEDLEDLARMEDDFILG
jgi:hypothetical protein